MTYQTKRRKRHERIVKLINRIERGHRLTANQVVARLKAHNVHVGAHWVYMARHERNLANRGAKGSQTKPEAHRVHTLDDLNEMERQELIASNQPVEFVTDVQAYATMLEAQLMAARFLVRETGSVEAAHQAIDLVHKLVTG